MRNILTKLREVFFAVFPITLIVLVMNWTLSPIGSDLTIRFVIGSGLIIIGLTLFLIGIEIGITPVGQFIGGKLAKANKLWLIIIAGIALGFIISIAEPNLVILANQIEVVTEGGINSRLIIILVAVGVGILVMIGLIRILYDFPLYILLMIVYGMVLLLAIFSQVPMIAIAFDASGATTGALTVPFILALATGISVLKKHGKSAEKDSFGLVGLATCGAVIGVLALSIIQGREDLTGSLPVATVDQGILGPFWTVIPGIVKNSALSLLPIALIFIFVNIIGVKLSPRATGKILKGFVYALVGLILFLTGVNAGFMDAGMALGAKIANLDWEIWIYLISFLLGLFTVLAEPAVYVLTHQIEDVTAGYIRRKTVLFALAIGVGLAGVLNVFRIFTPGLQLWHIALPGYLIAIVLMFFTPKLFVGIGFDAGGVATGPMSATFILAFSQGIAFRDNTGNLADAFGMIALIALTPVIAIEVLGIIYRIKTKKEVTNHEQ
jgi:hypothetical protein